MPALPPLPDKAPEGLPVPHPHWHTGQGFILYDFYLMVSGDLFDLSCQIIFSFSDHNGSIRHLRIVFYGNRIMRGVRNNHICLGEILHHSALGGFPHSLPDTAFDLRISFLLLIFFFHFLLGHSHVPAEFYLLVDKISCRNDHVDQ